MAVPFTEENSNSHFTGLFKKLGENLYKKNCHDCPPT